MRRLIMMQAIHRRDISTSARLHPVSAKRRMCVSFEVFECLHDYDNLLQSIHSHKDCVYNVAFENCGGVEQHATIDLHDMPSGFEVSLHHLT